MEKIKLNNLVLKNEDVDLDNYITFREEVKKYMNNPDWLGDFSKEDLEKLLNVGSIIWIYYLELTPVCSMMIIPSTKDDILKFGLDLDYKKVVDYGPMMVNYDYVGNGLQLQMLKELDSYCKNIGLEYVVTTVHPDNIYSIKNIEEDGFSLCGEKIFSRGKRNIYIKKL